MYISSFHIDGFGLYSNVRVEGLEPGLSIFLGGNEAGKSTCLEFLRVMLTGDRKSRGWKRFAPLAGGEFGGSLTVQCQGANGKDEEIKIFRRNGASTLALYAQDGRALPDDVLLRLLGGVNAEVYRKVFGFSLSELEKFESLSAEEVRNALYGASFGPGLVSPAEVLSGLGREMDKLFKPGGAKPALNADLAEYESIRSQIATLSLDSNTYDSLSLELDAKKEDRNKIRQEKNSLETERRLLEKRLGSWRKWEQFQVLKEKMAQFPQENGEFPEDAQTRLARLQEMRDAVEKQVSVRQTKLQRLREQRDAQVIDENLLESLPELRRLSERKNSFRQAAGQLSVQVENCARAKEDMRRSLAQLGPDWDCERIRSTDRSLFAREDLEKQAREMQAAIAARNTAIDYLDKINSEVENCNMEVEKAAHALEIIPQPTSILNDQQREELRQNMARLEESRRLEPGREKALASSQSAFYRAFEQTGLARPPMDDAGKPEHMEAIKLVDALLAQQAPGEKLAAEMREKLAELADINGKIRDEDLNIDSIKRRIDEIRARQRSTQGPRRDALEARAVALRSLRSVAANIGAEKERLADLDARVGGMEPPARIGSWVLLVFGIVFLLLAIAIFAAHWLLALTEIDFGQGMIVPINVWAGYGALVCGVAFMAGAMPGNGPEQKRRARELAQLQSRRETCALHLAELGEQANQYCAAVGVDSMDTITLDATEMLLEREKEQCFHEERARQEISALNGEYVQAQKKKAALQETARHKTGEAQQCRQRWHSLMQSLNVEVVPSPESATTFFAKVESARLAYENVANAQRELDALWEDLHILEDAILGLEPIADRIENSPEAVSLENAVHLTLESCREADQLQERRIKAGQTLQTLQKELARAQSRQEEAGKQFEMAEQKEKTARAGWSRCLEGLGLDLMLDPETVRQAFKFMENCLAAEEKVIRFNREMELSHAEIQAMREPLEKILDAAGEDPALDSGNNPDWLLTLDKLLARGEQSELARKERERICGEIREGEEELGIQETGLADTRSKIEALLSRGQCASEDEFVSLARLHDEKTTLGKRIDDLEVDLKSEAGDMPFEEFMASFNDSTEKSEEERLAVVSKRLDEIRDEENDLMNSIGSLAGRLDSMSATTALASLRQDEAMLKESMRGKAMRWSKLALARAIILKAKSIFEKERQPEVIKMASDIFAKITDGRWSGISSSLEDKSLLVISPDGNMVSPENLSRGAQEQTYLALRLAYIRNHAERSRPLPVIMDEILVNFDPERAARAALVIGDFAKGVDNAPQQILYFTCQPAMAEMLQKAAPKAPVYGVANGSISRAG